MFADCCSPGNKCYLAEGTTRMASSAWKGESIQWSDWSYIQRSRWTLILSLTKSGLMVMLPSTFQETELLETKKQKRKKEEAGYQSQALLLFKIAVLTSAPLAVCTTAFFSAVHLKLQSHPPAQVGKSFCRASEIKKSKDTCQLDHLLCWFANPEDFFNTEQTLLFFLQNIISGLSICTVLTTNLIPKGQRGTWLILLLWIV